MDVLETNKLIAEFLGNLKVYSVLLDSKATFKTWWYENGKPVSKTKAVELLKKAKEQGYLNSEIVIQDHVLKFHYSWDWLMPVVRKIVTDYEFNNKNELQDNEYRENIMDIVPFANIEDTYDAVILFIKWYNENN